MKIHYPNDDMNFFEIREGDKLIAKLPKGTEETAKLFMSSKLMRETIRRFIDKSIKKSN